jgi:hypothetical protein
MTVKALDTYGSTIAETVGKMTQADSDAIRTHFGQRKKALKQAEMTAA